MESKKTNLVVTDPPYNVAYESKAIISADSDYRVELVSLILTYEDIEPLQEIVRALREAGAIVNKSWGIHIHIDATKHTPNSLKNLVNLMASKEDSLYKSLAIDQARFNFPFLIHTISIYHIRYITQ